MNRVNEDLDRRWPALSYDLVQELAWNRFQHLMVVWRDAQLKTGIDGMGERPDELEMRLNESRDIKLKTYRHFTRRNSVSVSFCNQHIELPNRTTQKYQWRKRVVDWQVEFREMINPALRDLWIWKRMHEMLQWYGQEGMNSEESEVEDLEEIYCPKHLPWRRKSASEMMDLIDRVRGLLGQKSHSKKGRPPTRRIRNKSNGVSSQAACKGLPADLYDADWFDGLMRSERKALKALGKPLSSSTVLLASLRILRVKQWMMKKCKVATRSMKVRICRVVNNQLIDIMERIKRDGKL